MNISLVSPTGSFKMAQRGNYTQFNNSSVSYDWTLVGSFVMGTAETAEQGMLWGETNENPVELILNVSCPRMGMFTIWSWRGDFAGWSSTPAGVCAEATWEDQGLIRIKPDCSSTATPEGVARAPMFCSPDGCCNRYSCSLNLGLISQAGGKTLKVFIRSGTYFLLSFGC